MSEHSTKQDYPRDRFDEVEPYSTQQGAHRKEFPAPKGTGHLNAIILAGGVALAIGVGSFLWLAPSDPLNLSSPADEETASQPVDEPQDTEEPVEPEQVEEDAEVEEVEEPEPTAEPETVEIETPEEESPEPEEVEPTEEETEELDDSVDYELPISVYNASNIQGYAASVAQDLSGAGYNVPVADNWTGNVPSQPTVYFSNNEATALAVAEQVGAVAIYEPSVDGVLVVLTSN